MFWSVVVVVVGMVLALVALGFTAAVTTGRGIEVGDNLAAWLQIFAAVAVAAAAALITLGFAWLIARGGRKYLQEVKRNDAPYVPFVAVSAGVLTGVATKLLDGDPIVAILVGALALVFAAIAAKVVQRYPLTGLALYLVVPVVTLVLIAATGAVDLRGWLADRSVRDWLLLAAIAVIVVGVPTTVAQVERYKGSPTWQFGARLRNRFGSHSTSLR